MKKLLYQLNTIGLFRSILYILLYPLRYVKGYYTWAHRMRVEKRSHLVIYERVSDKILNKKVLPRKRKYQIRDYYKKFGVRINTRWHETCYALNGIDSDRYISEYLLYQHIEPHFNDMRMARSFSDKNLYSRHFPGVSQPNTILRLMGGQLYDASYKETDKESAVRWIRKLKEPVIIKPSLESGGGRNIQILKNVDGAILLNDQPNTFDDLLNVYSSGFIIQERVKQHKILDSINPHSLNTIRVITFRFKEKIHFLSSFFRAAGREHYMDNLEQGGLYCGIESDGVLHEVAYDKYFNKYNRNPDTNVIFGNAKIPNFKDLKKTVRNLHKVNFYCDIASWDIGIDETGEPVLIEANLNNQGLLAHQIVSGPLFGDLTEEVLREVFG